MTASLLTPFPPLLQALSFGLFAMAVVHVCQRLVERSAMVIGSAARHVAFSRAAMGIGSMVWALDAGGMFMYPGRLPQPAQLAPSIAALIILVATCRLTVPALAGTRRSIWVALAAIGLALGMLLGHLVLVSSFGAQLGQFNWQAALAALLLAGVLATSLALRHRSARLRAVQGQFQPLGWPDKALAALAIVPLHWLLMNMLPLPSQLPAAATEGMPLLITLVLFGMLMALDYLRHLPSDLQADAAGKLSMPYGGVESMVPASQQLAILIEHLPRLLSCAALRLHFQPIVDTQGELRRLEVLSRIDDTLLGRVHPERFFRACDLAGLTVLADRTVLLGALAHVHAWQRGQGPRLCITVNVAPQTLLDAGFEAWLLHQLHTHAIEAWRLKLELTEHALIANAGAMGDALRSLKRAGIGVLMDDFGAGYSSLGLLADLPIEGIKCDRQLIHALPTDRKRQVLLRHACQLARELGLSVTVEGVESAEEALWVRRLGAELLQGFHLAKPMSAEALLAWYAQQPPAPVAQAQVLPTV